MCGWPRASLGFCRARPGQRKHRECRLLQPVRPRACDKGCSGQSGSGSPVLSRAIAGRAAPGRPKADQAPDPMSPGWVTSQGAGSPDRGRRRGQPRKKLRGVGSIRGRARGSHSIADVGRCHQQRLAKAGSRGCSFRGKASWFIELVVVDATAVKVSLVFFSQRGLLRGEEGATEDVRSFFATLPTA